MTDRLYFTPCELGECPSDLMRELGKNDSPEKRLDIIAGCAGTLQRIVFAGDFQILIPNGVDEQLADDHIITFGPNSCPLMTPYSLE